MVAGVIQARMGSERCKNKMLRDFARTNLVTLALEKYSKPTDAFKLYFAAYEDKLLSVGRNFNCEIVKRNRKSAESERIEVIMGYLVDIPEETVIFINPCHVFLRLETLERAIQEFHEKRANSMTAVVKSHTWYYFLDGTAINYLDPTNINTKTTEPVYEVTHAFHIFNRKRFLERHYFWTHEENDPCFFEISEKEAIDIDTELDFQKAESLYIRENGYRTAQFNEKLAKIKMLVMDVDGVLTDAGMYYSHKGDELKKFNTRDGMGLKLLREAGIKQAIITAENTKIVRNRAKKLKIEDVHLGIEDKLAVIESILAKYSLKLEAVAYIGDDVNDLPVLERVGFPIAVADATESVQTSADYVTNAKGGEGAVREVCDLILKNINGEVQRLTQRN